MGLGGAKVSRVNVATAKFDHKNLAIKLRRDGVKLTVLGAANNLAFGKLVHGISPFDTPFIAP